MGCIVELLEEPCNACAGAERTPRHVRNALNKFINRRELFAEDVFDPELDLRCDLIIPRRVLREREEEGTYLQGNVVPQPVKTRSLDHGRGIAKSVAGYATTCDDAGSWRRRKTLNPGTEEGHQVHPKSAK